jgi:hypothetical protein
MITSDSPYLINEFYLAQVVNKKSSGDTYKSENVDNLFSIDVQTDNNLNPKILSNVQPCNPNIKQIPITGESVLIFRTINNRSKYKQDGSGQWYYTYPINVQSNINNNILPTTTPNPELDPEFDATIKTSPLQPYRGDLLIEGRWGNSIRFGSTINSGNYDVATKWNGSKTGDPVLILSNTTKRESEKNFLTESLRDDKSSSIYLSSTQQFKELKLHRPLRKYTKETEYEQSQLIAQANRVVLRSDKDVTVIDSNKAVVLNSERILLGNDRAESPMVHGDELVAILQDMLSIMLSGYTGLAGFPVTHARSADIIGLISKLENIKSKKYFIKK